MGEIAEMMLSGELCEACGGYIDGDAQGFLRYCSASCAAERGEHQPPQKGQAKTEKIPCPQCARFVKKAGLADHMRVVHDSKPDGLAGRVQMIEALRAIATDRQLKPQTMAKMAREALAAAGVKP